MGTIYQANCPCGFKQIDLIQGYGLNQVEIHYELYQCEHCHSLTSIELTQQVDSLFKPIRCPECKSTMSRLMDRPEDHPLICPECQNPSLIFTINKLWD
ncbi:MAG: hypothetical protein OEY52_07990 [Gammaproteobacteria bacterium]|nr:hypothetical protein [Gammaproteobacteria bacterium]